MVQIILPDVLKVMLHQRNFERVLGWIVEITVHQCGDGIVEVVHIISPEVFEGDPARGNC